MTVLPLVNRNEKENTSSIFRPFGSQDWHEARKEERFPSAWEKRNLN